MEKQIDIRLLTQRFFDGETTLQEEQSLYQIYAEGDVPADLIGYSDMMLGLKAMSALSSDAAIATETPTSARRPSFRLSFKILSIAASLLLILSWSVWLTLPTDDECVVYVYGERVTDQDVVMRELQLAISGFPDNETNETVETQLKDLFD